MKINKGNKSIVSGIFKEKMLKIRLSPYSLTYSFIIVKIPFDDTHLMILFMKQQFYWRHLYLPFQVLISNFGYLFKKIKDYL